MNRFALLSGVQTYSQGGITVDLELLIDRQLQQQSISIAEFMRRLTAFVTAAETSREQSNINPYAEKFDRGIHVLGKQNPDWGVFPSTQLVLKCSEGRWGAENPRKQFFRSVQLTQEFETRLTEQEKALLQICPVYLHLQTSAQSALFKRVLLMPKIEGTSLGETESGFSAEFCQAFNIPDLQQIRSKRRFALHRWLDRHRRRQLFKIQVAYLFQRLSQKGIKIFSLNQKNILVLHSGSKTRYVIIDPIADYYLPVSPLYNLLTAPFCK